MELHYEAFVYKWENTTTGAFYIGYHKGSQTDGYICSSKSDRFWREFNNPEFQWERNILFEGTQEDCVKEELRILESLDLESDLVYNNNKGGGIVFSKEVRDKMSDAKLGKPRPPIAEETRKKMSDAKLGKTYSAESRKKMSEGMKGRIPWNAGKSFSEESKKKMSDAKKGRTWAIEIVKKRADSNRGRTRETIVCPHCNKEGGKGAMIRWHNENCKKLKES